MAEQAPVSNTGCFLCGNPNATRVESSASDATTFRYECPACGFYDIQSVVHDNVIDPQQLINDLVNGDGANPPVEMEAAAIEYWSKTLDVAERQRRVPARPNEPQKRPTDSSESAACA